MGVSQFGSSGKLSQAKMAQTKLANPSTLSRHSKSPFKAQGVQVKAPTPSKLSDENQLSGCNLSKQQSGEIFMEPKKEIKVDKIHTELSEEDDSPKVVTEEQRTEEGQRDNRRAKSMLSDKSVKVKTLIIKQKEHNNIEETDGSLMRSRFSNKGGLSNQEESCSDYQSDNTMQPISDINTKQNDAMVRTHGPSVSKSKRRSSPKKDKSIQMAKNITLADSIRRQDQQTVKQ